MLDLDGKNRKKVSGGRGKACRMAASVSKQVQRHVALAELKNLPADLKALNLADCTALCREIRSLIVNTVSQNGGHMASNLGVVELTMAIHRVFDSPRDKILWDVGHQSYTHKLLTGRLNRFGTLRQEGGLSGFPRRDESEHDPFIAGHSSNSISAACGLAKGMVMSGNRQNTVVAVIGDGAFTGGMAYEGLNNAGKSGDPLVIILNHNDMSISKNVGALAKYLSKIRSSSEYLDTKNAVVRALDSTPLLGPPIKRVVKASKSLLKSALFHSTMFENLGFQYLGPVDGHNLAALEQTLMTAKRLARPVVVHVNTVKGKGFAPAEANPGAFHGVAKRPTDGEENPSECYSTVFGKFLTEAASKDNRICAITAAMKYPTGLNFFAKVHRERFFDVGIAEQHAITFGAGLAAAGWKPVAAIYSSFLQRAYDQIFHDAAIDKTSLVLAVDRAGFVGEDGETHQGLYDVPFLTTIPGIEIYSPAGYSELKGCMERALNSKSLSAVRYPRGGEEYIGSMNPLDSLDLDCDWRFFPRNGDSTSQKSQILAITYGRLWGELWRAVENLDINQPVDLLKLTKIFPIQQSWLDIARKYQVIVFFEEGATSGGIGEHFAAKLLRNGYSGRFIHHGVDGFVKPATVSRQLEIYKLNKFGMNEILSNVQDITAGICEGNSNDY